MLAVLTYLITQTQVSGTCKVTAWCCADGACSQSNCKRLVGLRTKQSSCDPVSAGPVKLRSSAMPLAACQQHQSLLRVPGRLGWLQIV